jgi:hypothetical protein
MTAIVSGFFIALGTKRFIWLEKTGVTLVLSNLKKSVICKKIIPTIRSWVKQFYSATKLYFFLRI